MYKLEKIKKELVDSQYTWLITGVAGFIGSNLLEFLLEANQKVIGLDNLSTGKITNIEEILLSNSSGSSSENFTLIEGDLQNTSACEKAVSNVDFVLHQAALGSVPRSIKDPKSTYNSNDLGFLNLLNATKGRDIKRFVFASSSSVYGDQKALPKVEENIGKPLSPYAATKLSNELYANVFFKSYGIKTIGLRYFNVFGKRQDPEGEYAAVIPKWIKSFINNEDVFINGDGETTRDFCFIDNVIKANILACLTEEEEAFGNIFNIACNKQTSLLELFNLLKEKLAVEQPGILEIKPQFKDFLSGDIRHSLADISKAKKLLLYEPEQYISEGLDQSLDWYLSNS